MRCMGSVASWRIAPSVEDGAGDSAPGSCGPYGSVVFVLGALAAFLFF